MIRALIFDLDDTLYCEKDFVMSGYRAVARYLFDRGSCSFEKAFSLMTETFETQGRQHVFPALFGHLADDSITIPELVEIYRRHEPIINLCPGYKELLQDFSRHYRLGIITDGLPAVQGQKVQALGLKNIMDKIIYTWDYGPEKEKPHPYSFSLMLQCLDTEPDSALFIGDNPEKDCKGAHGIGMKCIRPLSMT